MPLMKSNVEVRSLQFGVVPKMKLPFLPAIFHSCSSSFNCSCFLPGCVEGTKHLAWGKKNLFQVRTFGAI
jgi:hypothetical protein